MSTSTPPRRPRRDRVPRAARYSPPSVSVDEAPGTPGPTRARINHLENQVQGLVRKSHNDERKHRAEISTLEGRLNDKEVEITNANDRAASETKKATKYAAELSRCKADGESMRDDLHLFSLVQQQKALLALAVEQLQMVEMEQHLVHSEREVLMRDHKLALFKSHESDTGAEAVQREARISALEMELETANTSLAHQRAAESKAKALASSTQGESSAKISALEAQVAGMSMLEDKVIKLEASNRGLKEKEREARNEIERWLNEERSREGSADKERSELKAELRATKQEAAMRTQEAADALEELEALKESSRDREKALKAKYREAHEERLRLAGVEEELEALKASVAAKKKSSSLSVVVSPMSDKVSKSGGVQRGQSPESKKSRKATAASPPPEPRRTKKAERSRKTSPLSDESDDDEPKRTKAPVKPKSVRASDSERTDKKKPEAHDAEPPADLKKKKRRLLGGAAAPAFTWDPIMNSGDGVIPAYLSPVKPPGTRTTGTIPRAGFSNSRRF